MPGVSCRSVSYAFCASAYRPSARARSPSAGVLLQHRRVGLLPCVARPTRRTEQCRRSRKASASERGVDAPHARHVLSLARSRRPNVKATQHQNSSFRPNWLMRAGRAAVTTPKLLAVRFVDDVVNCVWLNTLNDSSRNCSRTPRVDREVLEQREIQVVHSGSTFRVPSKRAVRPRRRLRERRRVEPPAHRPLASVRVSDQIGAVGASGVVEPARIGGRDRQREPALPRVDAVDLPSADHRVLHAGGVARELLTAAEREVVDEAADQPMIDIEVRETVVAFRVVIVQEALPAVESARADAGGSRLRVGALRPRVGEGQNRPAPRCSSLVFSAW